MFGAFATSHPCTACRGAGKVPREKCDTCGGHGVLRREEEVVIAIPAGIEHGEMVRLTGGGEATPGGVPGDLYVKVHVKADKRYRKEGSDIVMPLAIKLSTALLGDSIEIETLEGPMTLKIPAGITAGERLRIKGKGVASRRASRGDLYVEISISIPTKLSKKAKEAIEQLRSEGL